MDINREPSIPAAPFLAFDAGTLLLTGAPDREIRRLFPEGLWTWDARVSAWRTFGLHYAQMRNKLRRRFAETFVDQVLVPETIDWPKVELPVLRAEQHRAVEAWRQNCGRGQVIMPTGTGKTEVALAVMAATRVATLVVAPVRDLMYQWHRRIFKSLGYDAGIVGDNTFNIKPVTVTTYDSAYIHMARMGAGFGLVIFDEEHHLPGPTYREAALMCAAPFRLGLTATPERFDGRHADLDDLIGPVVYHLGLPQVKGTTLADYRVARIPVALSESEQARYDQAGRVVRNFILTKQKEQPSYGWKDVLRETGTNPEARKAQRAYYLKQSIEDRAEEKLRVLEDLFRLHVGERVIVFAGSNAMAIDVSRRFLVPTLLAHSRKRERLEVLEGFSNGHFPVIVANQVLDEGVDVPEAKVAVVIGGQASTRQAKQRLGRILRRTGTVPATLYEVVCQDTNEILRSRKRRKSDAYQPTRPR